MKTILILLSLLLLSLPNQTSAQPPQPNPAQKGSKAFISVPVSVSDREGRYISGLKKDDFTIYQDGVKQNISFFATFDEPLNIALLLDTSGSTQGEALAKIKDAAKEFIELLNPTDKCMIATFDAEVNILNQFTSEQNELKKSIDKVQTAQKDGTVLNRAIMQITQTSFNNIEGRKVIVLLSDGKDFGSNVAKKDLMNLLEESDVLIYSIFYQTGEGFDKLVIAPNGKVSEAKNNKKPIKEKPPKKPRGYVIGIPPQVDIIPQEEIKYHEKTADIIAVDSLREMSDTTAGRFYLSDTPDLSKIFKQVASELREQYRLGYNSNNAANDLAVHDITVKVNKPNAVVKTRGKFRGKQ